MREPLLDGTFVAIDIEATGFNVEQAEVIDIGAVRIEGGIVTETFSSLINPGFFIPENIKRLTGITNAMVIGRPSIDKVLPQFLDFVGDSVIVGHNVSYDVKFIDKYVKLYKGVRFKKPCICTLQLSRRLLPDINDYSLKSVADHLGVEYTRVHRAFDDAMTAAKIFLKFLEIIWDFYGFDDYVSIKSMLKKRLRRGNL